MLVHRAAVPPPRIEALATELENGVRLAAEEFTRRHHYGSELGAKVASVLGQSDDKEGQTRRMAMTVIANALVFHESLAEVEFQVPEAEEAPPAEFELSSPSALEASSLPARSAWSGSASCR